MAEEKEFFDELVDAASLFEEIENQPRRDDIGDILFVEGIEEDESVVDEDLAADEEFEARPKRKMALAMPVSRSRKRSLPRKLPARRPAAPERERAAIPVAIAATTSAGGMTIGKFFLPLVRHSPVSKIRVAENSIGSIFKQYISRVRI